MEAHGAARRVSRTRALTDTADLEGREGEALSGLLSVCFANATGRATWPIA